MSSGQEQEELRLYRHRAKLRAVQAEHMKHEILGITAKDRAITVNVDNGIYSQDNYITLEYVLGHHIPDTIEPLVGWGRYTHVVRFEDVAWGIMVEEA